MSDKGSATPKPKHQYADSHHYFFTHRMSQEGQLAFFFFLQGCYTLQISSSILVLSPCWNSPHRWVIGSLSSVLEEYTFQVRNSGLIMSTNLTGTAVASNCGCFINSKSPSERTVTRLSYTWILKEEERESQLT